MSTDGGADPEMPSSLDGISDVDDTRSAKRSQDNLIRPMVNSSLDPAHRSTPSTLRPDALLSQACA